MGAKNFWDMSDEDIQNMNVSEVAQGLDEESNPFSDDFTVDPDTQQDNEEGLRHDDPSVDYEPEGDEPTETEQEESGEEESGSEEIEEEAEEGSEEEYEPGEQEEESEQETETESEGDEPEEEEIEDPEPESDVKAQLEQLFKPFKAAGQEVKIESVDEAVKLMQMGVDYNQKMSALKPARKLIKMLQNNDLLDESKISHLIDIASGDKVALAKLIKDKGIDTLDIDPEDGEQYTPSNHSVSDNSIVLDDVISEIQNTDTFAKTMGIATQEWDEASKRAIVENPQRLAVLNEHVSNGIYDMVQTRMAKERLMGRLPENMSNFEAYMAVGNLMAQEGAFNDSNAEPESKPKAAKVVKPKPKQVDKQLNQARQKVSSNRKGTPPKAAYTLEDLLNMSDDEVQKLNIR